MDWFLDEDVVKFSDNQYREFSLESQITYVNECIGNKNKDLYGVFLSNQHIGNILIDGLENIHRNAEITYLIGNKKYWGMGVASYAISKIVELANIKYKLNKIYAGCAENNLGSRKALEKNNFIIEGIRKKHLFYNDTWFDQIDYGLILD